MKRWITGVVSAGNDCLLIIQVKDQRKIVMSLPMVSVRVYQAAMLFEQILFSSMSGADRRSQNVDETSDASRTNSGTTARSLVFPFSSSRLRLPFETKNAKMAFEEL